MRKNNQFSWEKIRHKDLGGVILLRCKTVSSSKINLEVGIAPSLGSNMFRFRFRGTDLVHCDTRVLAKHDFTGNFVMWPFPNRVREKKWRWRGKEYSLERVVTPRGDFPLIHGLVRDRMWNFSEPKVSGDAVSFKTFVEMDRQSPYFDCYPFPSRLTLEYTLSASFVRVDYEVINLGKCEMPFGFALHPLFSTSLSGEDLTLVTLPASFVMEMEGDLLPTGRRLKLSNVMYGMFNLNNPHPVRDLQLDHVYTGLSRKQPAVIDHKRQKVRIKIYASQDFTHCVLYTMQREKFICVEHQTCSTDAHNLHARGCVEEAHLLTVAPGRSHKGFVVYAVEKYA